MKKTFILIQENGFLGKVTGRSLETVIRKLKIKVVSTNDHGVVYKHRGDIIGIINIDKLPALMTSGQLYETQVLSGCPKDNERWGE